MGLNSEKAESPVGALRLFGEMVVMGVRELQSVYRGFSARTKEMGRAI